ncbi:MAG TPA: rnhA operon protein [Natrialbaceae archaeon]|nr:rnhA operon protein [Natrialbaceae archaeon]
MTDLPDEAIATAERLTRLARRAVDENERDAYLERRAAMLGDHGYVARVREDDLGETLVLYPGDWVDAEGTVRTDRIEDVDRAVEVSLSGPGDPDEWDATDAHNRQIAAVVREDHGDVHGDNAEAFADFMSNHYAKRVEATTPEEIEEFLAEYFPRNAWPSDDQRSVIETSLEYVFEKTDVETPYRN